MTDDRRHDPSRIPIRAYLHMTMPGVMLVSRTRLYTLFSVLFLAGMVAGALLYRLCGDS